MADLTSLLEPLSGKLREPHSPSKRGLTHEDSSSDDDLIVNEL